MSGLPALKEDSRVQGFKGSRETTLGPSDPRTLGPSDPRTLGPSRESFSSKSRTLALARHGLVKAWLNHRGPEMQGNAQRTAEQVDHDFLALYNAGAVHAGLKDTLGEVSRQTLYRWKALIGDTDDWRALAPRYQASKKNTPRLAPAEERVFLGFLLTPNKIPIGTAVKFTTHVLAQRGTPTDKSPATFRRFADEFRANRFDVWTLMREGQKALKDKAAPYIKRDPSVLNVGDAFVADGHRLNFKVINPFTGRACRATLVGYLDWKSYDLVGYEIMIEEDTQCVASAFRNSVLRLGRPPQIAYQDNGRAFRARFFTSSPSLEEAGLGGLFGRLGVAPVFAQPYNARAKVIEGWFKTFSNSFERLLPSFTGASITDKPAWLMRNEKFHRAIHNDYTPTIEEAVQLIELWLQWQRTQECPHVKGVSIGEVFAAGITTDHGSRITDHELDDLMMEAKVSTLRRNGVHVFGQEYYNEALTGLVPERGVVIKYSLFDLSKVKVYLTSGEYLGEAERVMPVHPFARVMGTPKDMEALKRGMALQRRAEKKAVEGAKELLSLGREARLEWQDVADVAPRAVERIARDGNELSVIRDQSTAEDPSPITHHPSPVFDDGWLRYEDIISRSERSAVDEEWLRKYVAGEVFPGQYESLYGMDAAVGGEHTPVPSF